MNLLKLFKLVVYQVRKRGVISVIQKIYLIVKQKKFYVFFAREEYLTPKARKNSVHNTWILAANDTTWASNDYRGLNFNYAFRKLGIPTTFMDHFSFYSDHDVQANALGVVLFRTDSFRHDYSGIKLGVPIVYDIDDLCFDRRFFTKENVPGISSTTTANQEWLLGGSLNGQEDIVKNANLGTGPTSRITKSMQELGAAKVMLIDNVLPVWMAEQSRNYRRMTSNHRNEFRIVYASGSNTHRRDFAIAWQGLKRFLSQTPSATLTILGYSPFNRNEIPVSISNQVFFRPQVPHRELIQAHSNYDLAIAPLEQNEFTHGKSALKFVHAASLGIPCMASPTEPFVRALSKRFPNLIVNDEDWFEKVTQIFLSTSEDSLREELIDEFESHWTVENLTEQIRRLVLEL